MDYLRKNCEDIKHSFLFLEIRAYIKLPKKEN